MTSFNHSGHKGINRRRIIAITAAAAGTALLPLSVGAQQPYTAQWRGIALGAEASLTLQHPDETEAHAAIEASLAEVARLEGIFSLYRADSALVRLNIDGRLDDAQADLRILLAEAMRIAEMSQGAFDPTVQPLWTLYAKHFADAEADPRGPSGAAVAAALANIGWQNLRLDGASVAFARPGMAVTLNGIAQGYITDKVGDLLRSRGFEHVLVNMGEQLALGPKWDGSSWRIGIADPVHPRAVLVDLPLTTGAVSTSGGYGFRYDGRGRFNHIFDPRTGASARTWESVTVVADRSTTADALSTALAVAPEAAAPALLGNTAKAYVIPVGHRAGYWL
jgi:thiamine biosynthesis lipoprotein